MNDYIIRLAEPRDLPAVNSLLRQVLKVHHDGRPDLFRPEGKKYSDQELLAIFSDPMTPVFVYESGGNVPGYAFCVIQKQDSLNLEPITTLYIDDLCVDEQKRGKHIGTALFNYVKEYARQIGCHNITLHVWECNEAAKAFYEAMGMAPQYISMELLCK